MGTTETSELFCTLFWNIWVDSQLNVRQKAKLLAKFDDIIATYRPHTIGLNEVLVDEKGRSPVLKHLEKRGYHTYFAPFSPEKNGHVGGSAFASLEKPLNIDHQELGPDTAAAWRGHPGYTVKLIKVKLLHGKRPIHIVVNYLAHLVPYNWTTHVEHHRAFMQLTNIPSLRKATIIGGDFNQFKFMPWLWDAEEHYHRATGSILNPTWKWMGKIPVIQANYDNIFWTKCGTIELQDFQVLDRDPSDHTPLIAHFRIKRPRIRVRR